MTDRKATEGPFDARELEARQNELYLAMRVVEEMPASEAQTACIVGLGERMRLLVERLGKSEVGKELGVDYAFGTGKPLTRCPKPDTITWKTDARTKWARDADGHLYYNTIGVWHRAQEKA